MSGSLSVYRHLLAQHFEFFRFDLHLSMTLAIKVKLLALTKIGKTKINILTKQHS